MQALGAMPIYADTVGEDEATLDKFGEECLTSIISRLDILWHNRSTLSRDQLDLLMLLGEISTGGVLTKQERSFINSEGIRVMQMTVQIKANLEQVNLILKIDLVSRRPISLQVFGSLGYNDSRESVNVPPLRFLFFDQVPTSEQAIQRGNIEMHTARVLGSSESNPIYYFSRATRSEGSVILVEPYSYLGMTKVRDAEYAMYMSNALHDKKLDRTLSEEA